MESFYSKKMLFIYNPRAGKTRIRMRLADILDIFAAADYEMTVCPTRERGEARELVRTRRRDYDLVVCCGGDGTLDEVVGGMEQSGFSTPIGYIPAGSTNDFGVSLSLPRGMTKAAETIVTGHNFPCDIGAFNGETFVYIAAFGIFTEVSYETDQNAKNVLGHMAYVLEGVKSLQTVRHYRMKVLWEDQVIEDDFIYGMITNSHSVGGFKNITGENVRLDDGLFEVTLFKYPHNPVELNDIMRSLANRDLDMKQTYCFRTAAVRFESEEEIPWTRDGERGGAHRVVEIANRKQAIELRV